MGNKPLAFGMKKVCQTKIGINARECGLKIWENHALAPVPAATLSFFRKKRRGCQLGVNMKNSYGQPRWIRYAFIRLIH